MIVAAARFGEIGAFDLRHFAVFIHDSLVAAYDVRVFKAHITADLAAEIFGRRIEREIAPFNVERFAERDLTRTRVRIGLVDIERYFFRPLIVAYRQLKRIDDRHGAGRMRVEIVAHDSLEVTDLAFRVRLGNARALAKIADRGRGNSAVSQSRQRRHARIVPTVHRTVLHKLFQIPFAHDEVCKIQPRKFDLTGLGRKPEAHPHPIV